LRMLVHAPSVVISYTDYDTAKRVILAQKENFSKKHFQESVLEKQEVGLEILFSLLFTCFLPPLTLE
jgi:hypothetical protein